MLTVHRQRTIWRMFGVWHLAAISIQLLCVGIQMDSPSLHKLLESVVYIALFQCVVFLKIYFHLSAGQLGKGNKYRNRMVWHSIFLIFDHFWWKSTFQTWNHSVIIFHFFFHSFVASSEHLSFHHFFRKTCRWAYNIHKQWYASFSALSLCRIIHILYIRFFSMVCSWWFRVYFRATSLLDAMLTAFLLFYFSLLNFIHFFQCFFFFFFLVVAALDFTTIQLVVFCPSLHLILSKFNQ